MGSSCVFGGGAQAAALIAMRANRFRFRGRIRCLASQKEGHWLPVHAREFFQFDNINAPFARFTFPDIRMLPPHPLRRVPLTQPGIPPRFDQAREKGFVRPSVQLF
jgi:hypothetical protein